MASLMNPVRHNNKNITQIIIFMLYIFITTFKLIGN